ncbi:hypothetical protein M441DRAFT_140072, partial [Trichoderma asperellum CBS 433.97]
NKPPEFNSGKKVFYKKVQYTVASFDPVTDKYTIFLVEKVKQDDVEKIIQLDPLEEENKKKSKEQVQNASDSGSRNSGKQFGRNTNLRQSFK